MKQLELFGEREDLDRDLQVKKHGLTLGEACKTIGMAEAAAAKSTPLDDARAWAVKVCERFGQVTADDVSQWDLGPAAGSLFRGDARFVCTGRTQKSVQPKNHARLLMIWVLQ